MYILLVDTCWILFDMKTTRNYLLAQTMANKVDVAGELCFVKGAVSQGPCSVSHFIRKWTQFPLKIVVCVDNDLFCSIHGGLNDD